MNIYYSIAIAPEIKILPVTDIVSGNWHFLPVTRGLYRSQFATIILKECNSNLDKMSCITLTKILLLWLTTYNVKQVLEHNKFFANSKQTAQEKRTIDIHPNQGIAQNE